MAWSISSAFTQLTTVTHSTEQFIEAVTLTPGEVANLQSKADSSGTTGDAIVKVYARVDGTNWDNNALITAVIPTSETDPGYRTLVISGLKEFRAGFLASEATDTMTIDCSIVTDNVDL